MFIELFNPATPLRASFNYCLPSRQIRILGRINNDCEFFSINLQDGEEGDTIPLHIGFRFKYGEYVLNWREGKQWSAEQEVASSLPLKKGEDFSVTILCETDKYRVTVNQDKPLTYLYYVPLEKANFLKIEGGIKLEKVSIHNI